MAAAQSAPGIRNGPLAEQAGALVRLCGQLERQRELLRSILPLPQTPQSQVQAASLRVYAARVVRQRELSPSTAFSYQCSQGAQLQFTGRDNTPVRTRTP